MTDVALSWSELRRAALAGIDRHLYALAHGQSDRHNAPSAERGWQLDIQGAIAECVAARALNLYWAGGRSLEGDIGPYQVRSTVRPNGRLVVNPDDPPDAVFILVVGIPPCFRVPGWILGGDAQQDRYWTPGAQSPAYFVPQTALHPLTELVPT
jgi:hypothetical protein